MMLKHTAESRRESRVHNMQDIVFIAVTMAFFAICVAYIRGLDRLVRTSEEGEAAQEASS